MVQCKWEKKNIYISLLNFGAIEILRIMVLVKGFVVEFDTPLNLLARKGIFYSMAEESGMA